MLENADEIRAALSRAGHSVLSLVEHALTVEGRVLDVTNVVAQRPGQRAFLQIARACQEGDPADKHLTSNGSHRGRVVRRLGTTKLAIDVKDEAKAREELSSLLPALATPAFVDAVTDHLRARGWRVTSGAPNASDEWDGSWTIRAERGRGDATLEVGLVSGIRDAHDARDAHDGRDEISFQSGTAISKLANLTVLVTVTDAAAARDLADTLCRHS